MCVCVFGIRRQHARARQGRSWAAAEVYKRQSAGNTGIQVASEYRSADKGGQGLMLGGISGVAPAEVVIIGAGTVGEFATRAALGLGASVKVFDKSIYRLRRLQNDLGCRVWTYVIQPQELLKSIRTADVAIGALRSEQGRTSMVVPEEMVREMKSGSVIVDVSIDRGGCFETSEVTTHLDPVFKKYGVVHYCVPNIASRVPRTASYALTNIFTPILLSMGEIGRFEDLIKRNLGLRHGGHGRLPDLGHAAGEGNGVPRRRPALRVAADPRAAGVDRPRPGGVPTTRRPATGGAGRARHRMIRPTVG